jgi:hypothetical protein
MLAALALLGGVALGHTVRFDVLADDATGAAGFVVATEWLGVSAEVTLARAEMPGAVLGRAQRFSGALTGDPVRSLAVHLYAVDAAGARTEISASSESISVKDDAIAWAYSGDPPRARRVAAALPGRSVDMAEATGVAASLGWLGLVLSYCGWLARRREAAL